MIENYTRLSSRMFTATVVGKDKNGRKITEGRETYKTPSGVYEIKDWARLVEKAAEADGLLPLPEQIKRHVKEYAWMKNASDINVLILAAGPQNTEDRLRYMQQSNQYAKLYRFCQRKPSDSWLRSWKKQVWQTVSS